MNANTQNKSEVTLVIIFSIYFALVFHLSTTEASFQANIVKAQGYAKNVDENNDTMVSGIVYVNDLDNLTTSQFAMIRDCVELKYILTQVILYPGIFSSGRILERDRIVALAQAGKRIILQIWFGPGGSYNWSYCGYPNIAMQQEVRDYLFPVIDSVIDQIGSQNIYGMHLLEEDGHFCVDIDYPGRWWLNRESVQSGYEDGDPYSNFGNLRALYNGPSDWCQRVPNVAQYFPEFRKDTGLAMHKLPSDPLAYPVLDRWMARRLWAGAHRAFLQHLAEKYPNIKRFIWGHLAYEWNGTDIGSLADIVDGVITNNYNDTLSIHHFLSGIRKLLPATKLLVLLMDDDVVARKEIRATTAYLNGALAIGFYGSVTNLNRWNTSVEIWEKMSELPVLTTTQSKVLIVSGNTDNGYSTSKKMLTFFRNPVALTKRDVAGVNLSQYKIIAMHYCTSYRNDLALAKYNTTGYGPDDGELKNWVASGGLLILTAPNFLSDSQFFVASEGIAWTSNNYSYNGYQPYTFHTIPEIAEKYNIDSQYTLLTTVYQLTWGSNVSYEELPIGGITRYGNGRIVILPAFHCNTILTSEYITNDVRIKWLREMANYIADVARGVAGFHDNTGSLAEEITSKGEDFGLKYNNAENQISIKIVFEILGQEPYSEIYKSGKLILGGPSY